MCVFIFAGGFDQKHATAFDDVHLETDTQGILSQLLENIKNYNFKKKKKKKKTERESGADRKKKTKTLFSLWYQRFFFLKSANKQILFIYMPDIHVYIIIYIAVYICYRKSVLFEPRHLKVIVEKIERKPIRRIHVTGGIPNGIDSKT